MNKVVYPGDFIAQEEEFLPGKGTFVSDGKIVASNVGTVEIDYGNRVTSVKGKTQMSAFIHKGLVVVGVVVLVKDTLAFVSLFPKNTREVRYVPPQEIPAILHINHVKRGYVKSMRDELRAGDIIRAKVIEITQKTLTISINGQHLGVIKAYCTKCRKPLVRDKNNTHALLCASCGSKENRKLADDYRKGILY